MPVATKDKIPLSWFSMEFYLIILDRFKVTSRIIACYPSEILRSLQLPQNDKKRSAPHNGMSSSAEDNGGIGKRYGLSVVEGL